MQDLRGRPCNSSGTSRGETERQDEPNASALARLLQKLKGGPVPEVRLPVPGASRGCCIDTTSSTKDAVLGRNGTNKVDAAKPAKVNRQETGGAQTDPEKELVPLHPPSHPSNRSLNTFSTPGSAFLSPQPALQPASYPQTPAVQRFQSSIEDYRSGPYGWHFRIRLSGPGGIALVLFTVFMLYCRSACCCVCC